MKRGIIVLIFGVFLLVLLFNIVLVSAVTYTVCGDVPTGILNGRTCQQVNNCGTISGNNIYHLLMNDVFADRTCFTFGGSNSILDLNEYTVTFSNSVPMVVPNGGFETGNFINWDIAGAPSFSVISTASAYQPHGSWQLEELENWLIEIPAGISGEYIYSQPISVTLGKKYALSAMFYPSDLSPSNLIVEIDNGVGCQADQASGGGWGSDMCVFVATTSSVIIKVGIASALGQDAYIDAIELKPSSGYVRNYGDDLFGIRMSGSNSRITNGNIIQGQERGYFPNVVGALGSGQEVDHLNIIAYGPDTVGILSDSYDHEFHHNNITLNGKRTYRTHGPQAGAIWEKWGGDGRIYNNFIIRSPAMGIGLAEGSYAYNNTINIESSSMHCYAIDIHGGDVKVFNNFINTTQGGGVMIGTDGSLTNVTIFNNYIEVRDGPQEEYGGAWTSKALWTRYGVGGLNITNNIIIGYGGQDVPRIGADSMITTVRIGAYDDSRGPIYFYNNYVEAKTNLAGSGTGAIALDLSSDALTIGQGVTEYIYNNTFKSNDVLIAFGGSLYHSYATAMNSNMVNNTFIWQNDFPSSNAVHMGSSGSRNNVITDSIMLGGADINDVVYTNAGERGLDISWTLNVEVLDSGVPVDASVEIKDNSGSVVSSGTSTNGVFSDILLEEEIRGSGSSPTETYYTPYNVSVTYLGETQFQDNIDLNQPTTLQFFFSGGNPDVNSDGNINIIDLALEVYWQGYSLPDNDYNHLDINEDGFVNWLDIIKVLLSI